MSDFAGWRNSGTEFPLGFRRRLVGRYHLSSAPVRK
jgi:hypothetical protein